MWQIYSLIFVQIFFNYLTLEWFNLIISTFLVSPTTNWNSPIYQHFFHELKKTKLIFLHGNAHNFRLTFFFERENLNNAHLTHSTNYPGNYLENFYLKFVKVEKLSFIVFVELFSFPGRWKIGVILDCMLLRLLLSFKYLKSKNKKNSSILETLIG